MQTETTIPAEPGIYRLTIGPRTFYWGQSQDLRSRRKDHLNYLRRGTHHNSYLQHSFNKHGEEAFTFEVSLFCEVEELNRYEQHFIDRDHGSPGCANIAKCAEAPGRGLKHSDETRAKISEARKGVPLSAEHRAKMSAAKKGIPHSAERVAKNAEVHNRRHPNILVFRADGSSTVYPSMRSAAAAIGLRCHSALRQWLSGRRPIPAKYNIAAVSRTNRPATINPEAL